MTSIFHNPPIAFLLYLGLAGILYLIGRALAGPSQASPEKTKTYSSGEVLPSQVTAPGYRPFFVVALFFAIVHLGMLVLGSGGFTPITIIYMIGLIFSLLALILG